jgi:hypothetical protein
MTEPLFKSAHDALIFAFNYADQQSDRSAMSRLMSGPLGAGKGLSGIDGAAQAGFILAKVRALGALPEAILTARYAPRTKPCACCASPRPADRWHGAIRIIQDAAIDGALSSQSSSNRALRTVIVSRAFGSKESLVDAAEQCGVHRNTATKHNGLIVMWLRGRKAQPGKEAVIGEEAKAMAAIEDMLTVSGVVGELMPA